MLGILVATLEKEGIMAHTETARAPMREPSLEAAMQETGLLNFQKPGVYYDGFLKPGQEMARRAQEGVPGEAFAFGASHINANNLQPAREANVLLIDVGGSDCRGVLQRFHRGEQTQTLQLFYEPNKAFCPGQKADAFSEFAELVASAAAAGIARHGVRVDGIGIIWSNELDCRPISGDVRGVTGVVCGMGDGGAYRKGEPFTPALYNGRDVGAEFQAAFQSHSINSGAFLIGNDTVFTLCAEPGARAGMVASTGANCTLLDKLGFIHNAESGGRYRIDPSMLSKGDVYFLQNNGPIKLEDLIAGRWLPRVVEGNVCALAQAGVKEFMRLAAVFEQNPEDKALLTGKDLTSVLKGDIPEALPEVSQFMSGETYESLRKVIEVITQRAGALAAGMAAFSVNGAASPDQAVKLSLDSSQARFLPGYEKSMLQQLEQMTANGALPGRVEVVLKMPKDSMTVPMQGLARAVASL